MNAEQTVPAPRPSWWERGSRLWRALRHRCKPRIGKPLIGPSLSRYALAIILSGAGVWTRLLLHPLLGSDTPIMLSIVAVAVAAWLAGFGPGLLATLVGFLGGIALLMPPWGTENILSLSQIVRLLLFLVTGLIVSGLTEALYQAESAWHRAEQDQENRILQERNRMAREIHDTLAQGLTGIIIQLEAAEDCMAEAPYAATTHMARAQELARHSLTEARRSVHALRPQLLEERDLAGALAHYAEQMTTGIGVRAEVVVEGIPPAYLSPEISASLLRIGVEALTNAVRHARADTVRIELIFETGTIALSIRDDGRGFVPHSPHSPQSGGGFGLTGMWERAERIGGKFTLESHRGEGTEVKVVVSLNPAKSPLH